MSRGEPRAGELVTREETTWVMLVGEGEATATIFTHGGEFLQQVEGKQEITHPWRDTELSTKGSKTHAEQEKFPKKQEFISK